MPPLKEPDPESIRSSCRALIEALDEGALAAVGRRRTTSVLAPVIAMASGAAATFNPLPAPIEVVMHLLDRRTLTDLAVVNIFLHVIGLLLALVGMGPGTPLVSLPERLDYLARSPLGWYAGWVSWMLCSWVLLAFLAVLSQRIGDGSTLARIGLTVAIVAAGFDLAADSIFLVVLPELAAAAPRNEALFLAVERLTGVVSLVVANGGYSVATLLFSIALSRRQGLLRGTTAIGYAVAGFGLLLAGAGFTGVPSHAQWATPPTIGLYCVWTLLVARSLESSPRSP